MRSLNARDRLFPELPAIAAIHEAVEGARAPLNEPSGKR
jgi:hypothetical protein